MSEISASSARPKKTNKCKPGHEPYTPRPRQKIGILPLDEASSSMLENVETVVGNNSSRPQNPKSPSNIDGEMKNNNDTVPKVMDGGKNIRQPDKESIYKKQEVAVAEICQKDVKKWEEGMRTASKTAEFSAKNRQHAQNHGFENFKSKRRESYPRNVAGAADRQSAQRRGIENSSASKTQESSVKNAAAVKQPFQSRGSENLASKTRESSTKNVAPTVEQQPAKNHGFENLRKANASKWKPRNRQSAPPPPTTMKKSTTTLDDESGSSTNNTFNDIVLKKGFTVENSTFKTLRPNSTGGNIGPIALPPPPKKFSDVEATRRKMENLKIAETTTSTTTLEEKLANLSLICNTDLSWPEIVENEERERRREKIDSRILEGPGIIKISNEIAAVFDEDSTTKKSKGRGFQYSDENNISGIKQAAYNVFDQKSAGRGKYLRRDAALYSPPGGNQRRSAGENDDQRRFRPENLFLQQTANGNAVPPPAKFSAVQEKSFVAQNLDPMDQMVAGMKLLLGRGGAAPIDINQMMALRRVIQERYEKVVQMDYNANFRYGVERKMWKSAFYDVIEFMRDYMPEIKSPNLVDLWRDAYRNLIDEGIKCYENLLDRSLSGHKISLQDFLLDFDENLQPQLKIRKSVLDLHGARKYVLYTCHKFIISLGDLERYKEQIDAEILRHRQRNGDTTIAKTYDFSAARRRYSEATHMLPSYGRPYNQLALLAQYTGRKLDTVYYFFRSLSVKHAFVSAVESMKCTFDEMKQQVDNHRKKLKIDNLESTELKNKENIAKIHRNEIWIDPESCLEKPWPVFRTNQNDVDVESDDVIDRNSFREVATQHLHKQFEMYFLALHGMIYRKIDLDKFEEFAEFILKQMREILSRGQTPFTAFSLVQIAFICLFNVEEAGEQANIENLPKDQCPVQFQHAVKLALSIFGLLIEKLHELWISGNRNVDSLIDDPFSNVLLPSIRIFCLYLSSQQAYDCYSNSGYLEPLEKPSFRVKLWSHLADLANFWCDYRDKMNENRAESEEIRITLPEDDLCFPIKKIAKSFDVKVCRSSDEPLQILANKIRLNSLVDLLEFWDAQEKNKIYLPINIEDGEFFVVDRESPDDRPPGTIFKRRSAASQSENDHHSDVLNSSDNSHDISAETLAFRTNRKDEEAKNALWEKEQKTRVVLRVEPVYLAPDTNTFIDHLDAIEKLMLHFKCFKLRVPLIVVDELKGLTKDFDNKWKAQQSKESLEFLRRMEDDCTRKSRAVQYITVHGSLLDSQDYSHEDAMPNTTNDDRILTSCIKFLSSENTKQKSVDISIEPIELRKKLVLLTGDRNLRVKAISKEVPVRTIGEFLSWVESKPQKR